MRDILFSLIRDVKWALEFLSHPISWVIVTFLVGVALFDVYLVSKGVDFAHPMRIVCSRSSNGWMLTLLLSIFFFGFLSIASVGSLIDFIDKYKTRQVYAWEDLILPSVSILVGVSMVVFLLLGCR